MNNVLITGAGGFIGWALYNQLKNLDPIGVDYGVSSKPTNKRFEIIDLRDAKKVKKLLDFYDPEVVFHLAAMTNPKKNDENPELAKECNIDVTQNIVNNLSEDSRLIFLSTDKVLDGNLDPYPSEELEPSPIGLHSLLKYKCEQIVKNRINNYHIFRLSVVHSSGNDFAISAKAGPGSFIDHAINNIRKGKETLIYDNIYRCFLRVNELVDFLEKVIRNNNYGIYHLGSEMMSYYERIKILCIENNLEYNNKLIPEKGDVNPLKQDINTNKLKEIFNYSFT